MAQDKLITLKVSDMPKSLGFNKNLLRVLFSPQLKTITFVFKNVAAGSTEIDHFDLYENGYDLNFFEEFADSCISGFCGLSLSDSEVTHQSEKLFRVLQKFIKEQQGFQKWFSATQAKIKSTVIETAQGINVFSQQLPLRECLAL